MEVTASSMVIPCPCVIVLMTPVSSSLCTVAFLTRTGSNYVVLLVGSVNTPTMGIFLLYWDDIVHTRSHDQLI